MDENDDDWAPAVTGDRPAASGCLLNTWVDVHDVSSNPCCNYLGIMEEEFLKSEK